jgi:hypothetical protein
MKMNYPDVSELFKMKSEWRRRRAERPVSDKIQAVSRLRQLSKEVPKLSHSNTLSRKKQR